MATQRRIAMMRTARRSCGFLTPPKISLRKPALALRSRSNETEDAFHRRPVFDSSCHDFLWRYACESRGPQARSAARLGNHEFRVSESEAQTGRSRRRKAFE